MHHDDSFYLVADLSNWLAMYGNIGPVARLGSYRGITTVAPMFHNHSTAMSLGGGFQASLASRMMFGIGYTGTIDFHDGSTGPRYNTIHAVVAQIGYRL